MTSLRLGSTYGLLHAGEYALSIGDVTSWNKDGTKRALIWCHGATGTAHTSIQNAVQRRLIRTLAAHFTVIVADLHFDVYGNDDHIAAVGDAIAWAQSAAGTSLTLKPLLYGESMGAAGALNYAKANPSAVQAIACAIPAVDPQEVVTSNRGGLRAAINAAYPPLGYSDLAYGADHSPVTYASSLPVQSTLPIKLWTSSNDPLTIPSTANAFLAARPSTERQNMGAVGHSADSTNGWAADITSWLVAQCPEAP